MNKEEPEVQPKAIGELGSSRGSRDHLLIELWSLEREVEGSVNAYTSNIASAEYRSAIGLLSELNGYILVDAPWEWHDWLDFSTNSQYSMKILERIGPTYLAEQLMGLKMRGHPVMSLLPSSHNTYSLNSVSWRILHH